MDSEKSNSTNTPIIELDDSRSENVDKIEEENRLKNAEEEADFDNELANLVTAEEFIEKNGQTMVEFEKQMFKDLCYADGLIVCGK